MTIDAPTVVWPKTPSYSLPATRRSASRLAHPRVMGLPEGARFTGVGGGRGVDAVLLEELALGRDDVGQDVPGRPARAGARGIPGVGGDAVDDGAERFGEAEVGAEDVGGV